MLFPRHLPLAFVSADLSYSDEASSQCWGKKRQKSWPRDAEDVSDNGQGEGEVGKLKAKKNAEKLNVRGQFLWECVNTYPTTTNCTVEFPSSGNLH